MTINKNNAANIIVTSGTGSFKIISATSNVTVNNQFQISGTSSISLTKGGVTIGIANGKATSITDLKTDKEFVFVQVHSTGEGEFYSADDYFAKITIDGNKYTLIKRIGVSCNASDEVEISANADGSSVINGKVE